MSFVPAASYEFCGKKANMVECAPMRTTKRKQITTGPPPVRKLQTNQTNCFRKIILYGSKERDSVTNFIKATTHQWKTGKRLYAKNMVKKS